MRLKYNSKKPRRVEIVVFGGDVLDLPKRTGEALLPIAGFEKTTAKETVISPFEHLDDVADAIGSAEGLARDEIINAVHALAGSLDAASTDGPRPDSDSGDGEPSDAFDPAAHNVDDVLAHVDANPDQRDAVLEAEKAGKARKTIVEALEAPADE